MKKLNITKEQFEKSKYFKDKYGKLEYVSESGKLFKTSKGKLLKFKESTKQFGRKFMKEERKSDPNDKKKHEYEEEMYDNLYHFLKDKDYVLDVDFGDVPLIVTTNEGYCFEVKVEPCEYDWDEKDIENYKRTGYIMG